MIPLRQRNQVTCTFLLALTVSGCDSGKDGSVARSSCNGLCSKLELCDDRTDQTGCQSACESQTFRSDTYFMTQEQCAEDLSCNHLDGPGGGELDNCIGDELRQQEASEDAEALCRGFANHLADCESSFEADGVQSRCERIAITLSDEYLSKSKSCNEERCQDLKACFRDIADQYDTDVSIYPDI